MFNDYSALIRAIQSLETLVNELYTYLQGVLTPILYVLCFALFLKIGFTCMRGYKV